MFAQDVSHTRRNHTSRPPQDSLLLLVVLVQREVQPGGICGRCPSQPQPGGLPSITGAFQQVHKPSQALAPLLGQLLV